MNPASHPLAVVALREWACAGRLRTVFFFDVDAVMHVLVQAIGSPAGISSEAQ